MKEKPLELIDYIKILTKWRIFIALGVVIPTWIVLLTVFLIPKKYEARVTLMSSRPLYKINLDQRLETYAESQYSLESQIRLLTGDQVLESLSKRLQKESPDLSDKRSFLKGLISIETYRKTNLFDMIITYSDPEKTALIANTWADEFVSQNKQIASLEFIEKDKVLSKQLQEVEQQHQEANLKLENFMKEHLLVSLTEDIIDSFAKKKTKRKLESLANYQQSLDDIEAYIEQLSQLITYVKSKVKELNIIPGSAIFNESLRLQLLQASNFEKNSDLVVNLDLTNLTKNSDLTIEECLKSWSEIKNLMIQRRNSLENSILNLQKDLQKVQAEAVQAEQEYYQLKSRTDQLNDTYQLLSNKVQEVKLQLAGIDAGVKIIDPAVKPESPSYPKKKLAVVITFIISLILSILGAFLVEYVLKYWSLNNSLNKK